jgi:hypothetical protein
MGDTMMIRPNKAIAGAPPKGEIGEVDADFGKMLVDNGHAIDVSELHARLALTPEERYLNQKVDELKTELADRELPVSGNKEDLVKRLLEDDEAPEDPVDEADDKDDIDYRSSDSGKYVTEEYAQRHPKQTEGENYED